MRRTAVTFFALAFLAACSGSDGASTPSSEAITTSTTLANLPPELTGATALGIGDRLFPTLGNPGYDVQHYTLDLRFEPADKTLAGRATIEAVATTELATINLDFTHVPSAVLVDSTPVPFGTIDDDLVVQPLASLGTGSRFAVEVEYQITAGTSPTAALDGRPIGWFTRDDEHFVLAEPDGARTWFPANDHPLDKATYTFTIDVPAGLTAAANGILVDAVTDAGRTKWTWSSPSPMASYLATAVVGPFEVVEDPAATAVAGVPIRHVLPKGTGVGDWPGLERTGEMLAFLADRYGPFPFETFGVALVNASMGVALETQTLSVVDAGVAASSPELFDEFLVHELAHHWFGNSVSLEQWSDIWLIEGSATYSAWLWQDANGAFDLDGRTNALHEFWSGADPHPIGNPAVDELFATPSYEVGALTLHALRVEIGDDAFFELLRTFADQYRGSAASTAEFITLASEIAERDLNAFFESWLRNSQLPELPGS